MAGDVDLGEVARRTEGFRWGGWVVLLQGHQGEQGSAMHLLQVAAQASWLPGSAHRLRAACCGAAPGRQAPRMPLHACNHNPAPATAPTTCPSHGPSPATATPHLPPPRSGDDIANLVRCAADCVMRRVRRGRWVGAGARQAGRPTRAPMPDPPLCSSTSGSVRPALRSPRKQRGLLHARPANRCRAPDCMPAAERAAMLGEIAAALTCSGIAARDFWEALQRTNPSCRCAGWGLALGCRPLAVP